MAGLDPFEYNPNSPAGEIEQTEAFAHGLTRLRGWRRAAARWGVLALFLVVVALFVISALGR